MSSARDNLMYWKTARVWIPYNSFMSLLIDTTMESQAGSASAAVTIVSGPAELALIPMSSDDEVHTLIPIPWDLDRDEKVLARLYFVHASTDADANIDWIVGSSFFSKQATLPELQGGSENDVAFAAHLCSTTDDSIEVTTWTDLGWDDYISDTDVLAGLAIELQDDGASTGDETEFMGIELAYTRKATQESPGSTSADLLENPAV